MPPTGDGTKVKRSQLHTTFNNNNDDEIKGFIMTHPSTSDLKAFIPAQDFALSLAFYKALGFTLNWQSEEVAEFQVGDGRFLLQNFYHKDWAENCMLQLVVDDAQ